MSGEAPVRAATQLAPMGSIAEGRPAEFEQQTLIHAFTWLAVGNGIGLLMATLLLFPPLGQALGHLTYGRWAAVHIDVQMYGWCTLPLLALLFHVYSPPAGHGRLAYWAIRVWSGALAFVAVSSLSGHSSGKVFVEWTGAARWVFGFALAFASLAVIAAYARRWRAWRRGELRESRLRMALRGCGLLALLPAPIAMVWASSPGLYPPINPESGGSTSTNTLASVLGVGLLLALFPYLAGLEAKDGGRFARLLFPLFGLHFLFVSLLGPGDHSHREPLQLVALVSSLLWLPLLWRHLRLFSWPEAGRLWLPAMGGWGIVLTATGLVAGLPGMAERIKYTNYLVGHVHAAAAGLVTAWLFLLLDVVLQRRGASQVLRRLLVDRPAFFSWQAGSLLHILALLFLGPAEGSAPQLLWSGAPIVAFCYSLRLAGGLLMALASWRYLRAALDPAAAMSRAEENEFESLDQALLPAGRGV